VTGAPIWRPADLRSMAPSSRNWNRWRRTDPASASSHPCVVTWTNDVQVDWVTLRSHAAAGESVLAERVVPGARRARQRAPQGERRCARSPAACEPLGAPRRIPPRFVATALRASTLGVPWHAVGSRASRDRARRGAQRYPTILDVVKVVAAHGLPCPRRPSRSASSTSLE
jgi:hypothetical protein